LIPQFPAEGGTPPVLVVKPVTSSRVVRLGFAEHLEDGSFLVPIWIDNMDGVLSGRLEVRYNPAILKVKEVRKGLLLGDYLFVSNVADGKALMSFAGSESRQGAGWIAEVVFDLVNRVSEEVSEVRLDAVQLNEGRIAISSAASITVNRIPEAYRLAQNFPNPFNARTVVPFDLPAGGKVHLSIYNIAGQRVRTLVNGWREAGFRSVIWDGRDRGGREVASGVYLVRLEGSDFTEAKRMVLLR
ncbi:MAG: T9SS type A sorting domain-containing protein, partial [Candidatus Latescibacteria bacterium]|nr:T9SS type A sorting domain-containing protein [Candidatus Latescibacterota bacterium]